jgi:hypothetical protein
MLRPGQELREFKVFRPETRETELGRIVTNQLLESGEIGKVKAILAQATPEEIQRWRQLTHPITHKIIMRSKPDFEIKTGDVFERDGRRFYHQKSPVDVGDLGHWNIFYCEERSDVT